MKKTLSILLGSTLLTSCHPKVGPANLRDDCLSYNSALQGTNDAQILLNIVRMRYSDTPTFLQVGIISSAYEFKKAISGEFKDVFRDSITGDVLKLGLELNEKPTVTYSPLRGEGFVKEFMSPISFETILLLNSSGWGIDRILRCCVQRMNDLKNAPTASGPTPSYIPEFKSFRELMEIFRQLEMIDAINIVVVKNVNTGKRDIVFELDPSLASPDQLKRIWTLLGVAEGSLHIRFVPYHGQERAPDEVMLQTRSPLSVLYFLAQGVNVPPYDETRGVVALTTDECGNGFNWQEVLEGIMDIQSTSMELNQCYLPRRIRVCYRGFEFFIDDRDINSKATFSMVSQLMSLQTGCVAIPALTLPLN